MYIPSQSMVVKRTKTMADSVHFTTIPCEPQQPQLHRTNPKIILADQPVYGSSLFHSHIPRGQFERAQVAVRNEESNEMMMYPMIRFLM